MTRPSRRHCNVLVSRARYGYNEDQLAHMLGITRETMRGWAKKDEDFAGSLEWARHLSQKFWDRVDDEVRRHDMREAQKGPKARKTAPKPKEQPTPVKATKPRALTKAERKQEDAAYDHALSCR